MQLMNKFGCFYGVQTKIKSVQKSFRQDIYRHND